MIKKHLLIIICLIFLSKGAFSQTVKTSFEVAGVCDMCKERIENALDIKGVKVATWSVKTKICNITYNSEKITEKEIHKILASVGHDTQECRASDDVYNNLYYCCQYKRAEVPK